MPLTYIIPIGPYGSGKTTLVNLLLKKVDPTFGNVRLGTFLNIAEFEQMSMPELMREILIYHVRGVANAKGIAYLQEKLMTTTKTQS